MEVKAKITIWGEEPALKKIASRFTRAVRQSEQKSLIDLPAVIDGEEGDFATAHWPPKEFLSSQNSPCLEFTTDGEESRLALNMCADDVFFLPFGEALSAQSEVSGMILEELTHGGMEEQAFSLRGGKSQLEYHRAGCLEYVRNGDRGPTQHWRLTIPGELNERQSVVIDDLSEEGSIWLDERTGRVVSEISPEEIQRRANEADTELTFDQVMEYSVNEEIAVEEARGILISVLGEGNRRVLPEIPRWLAPLFEVLERDVRLTREELTALADHYVATDEENGRTERLERIRNEMGWDLFDEEYSAWIQDRIDEGAAYPKLPDEAPVSICQTAGYFRDHLENWYFSDHTPEQSFSWGYGTFNPIAEELRLLIDRYEDDPEWQVAAPGRVPILRQALATPRWVQYWPAWHHPKFRHTLFYSPAVSDRGRREPDDGSSPSS